MSTKEPRFHGEVTEKSHKNMSKIRGKDTSIEVVLRKALWNRGFRYRKNYKGKNPDYWVKKIERNIQRDEEKDQQLNFMEWTVVHFWGKDILKDTEQCVRVIEETIFDQKLENIDDEEEI